MQVLSAKRQEENCTGRYLKGLKIHNVERFCESKSLNETQVQSQYFISCVESKNNIQIKMTCHRVIGGGCIWFGISLMNAQMLAESVSQ